MSSAEAVSIIEVAPRDGLQNEDRTLDTARKAELVKALVEAGAQRLEVTSFVRPGTIPQLADADELMALLTSMSLPGSFIGLVLNRRGAERAAAFERIDELNYVVPCSDSFGLANQGQTTADALKSLPEIARIARDADKSLSVTLAVAFGCPYEGETSQARLTAVIDALEGVDYDELAIADTLGCAVPAQTRAWCAAASDHSDKPLRVHLHETRRTGLANLWAAFESGVRRFDASAGGLGGCPYAPGAAGNVATEDVAWLLERSGATTGLSPSTIAEIGARLCGWLGKDTQSGIGRAGIFPPVRSSDGSDTSERR